MAPTIAPVGPAAVSPRPSPTLATRRIDLGPDDHVVNALAQVADGDVVTLRPGTTLPGLTLPPAPRTGWVSLVGTGVTTPSLVAPAGARGWRVAGLTVTRPAVPDAQTVFDLVNLAEGSRSIALEGLVIRGTATGQTRRGISMNGADLSLVRSAIDEIHVTGQDSQGVNGLHGAGPFLLEDVAINCGTEGIMFGGGDPSMPELIPSDITLRRVALMKSESMMKGPWVRKNLLELKNAQRVLVENCGLADFPGGVALVLTPRNQDGSAPWCTVRDVLIRDCLVQRVHRVLVGLTTDSPQPSALAARIALRNLRALEIADAFLSWSAGRSGAVMEDLEITHCTSLPHSRAAFILDAALFRRLTLRDNLLGFGAYSQQWTGQLTGEDSDVRQNVLVNAGGGDGGGPTRNRTDGTRFLAANPAAIGLDVATGVLAPSSPYAHAATDGQAIGALPTATAEPPVVVPPEPAPPPSGELAARVTALEADVAALKKWRAS